jgi:2-hydroxychromene-2-carboxylate isomerase
MRQLVFVLVLFAARGTHAQLAVDAAVLDPAQRAAFDRILADEVCPCDCPKSLGQCLQTGTKCRTAVLLGQWLVDSLADGVPVDSLTEALAKEIGAGISGPPKKPALTGYATKGAARPKTVIVEYADFECAHCRAAAAVVDEFVKKHPDVQVVFKHLPLSFHAMATKAAIAAEAAGRQGRFWPMHDAIFATQDFLSDDLLLGHAKAIGLDVARFQKDLADPELAKRVEQSRAEGQAFGFAATPSFLVDGRPYHLFRSLDGFELRLRLEAARSTSTCQ